MLPIQESPLLSRSCSLVRVGERGWGLKSHWRPPRPWVPSFIFDLPIRPPPSDFSHPRFRSTPGSARSPKDTPDLGHRYFAERTRGSHIPPTPPSSFFSSVPPRTCTLTSPEVASCTRSPKTYPSARTVQLGQLLRKGIPVLSGESHAGCPHIRRGHLDFSVGNPPQNPFRLAAWCPTAAN